MSAPRILHAPDNIGNQPWVLSRHERALGAKSDFVALYAPPVFDYRADVVLGPHGRASAVDIETRVRAGLRLPHEYDVLHFYYGRTLFSWDDLEIGSPYRFLDLELAKALGKTVFFTLQGCDVRLAGRSFAENTWTMCAPGRCSLFEICIERLDADRLRLIHEVLPAFADRVFYLNPELGRYVGRGEFLPYSSTEIDALLVTPPRPAGPIRVVHAPSNPSIKGTALILAALEALKAEFDLDVVLIQGLSHPEAMRAYADADFVIDQVLAGWYGGLAVETMAMGKPTACYIRDEDLVYVPPAMAAELPLLRLDPGRIVDDLRAHLSRRAGWGAVSARSRRFVERWHDPRMIAEAMLRLYADPAAALELKPRASPAADGPV